MQDSLKGVKKTFQLHLERKEKKGEENEKEKNLHFERTKEEGENHPFPGDLVKTQFFLF